MLSSAMENDPQSAWKILNELKTDSLPADKAEKINRTQWFTNFRDLLVIQTKLIMTGKIPLKKNYFSMKTHFKMVL